MSYYKARMYSPVLGRFMQTDPSGFAGGMNIYAYTGNNPVNGVDPTGLCGTVTIILENGSSVSSTGAPCGGYFNFDYVMQLLSMFGSYGVPPEPFPGAYGGGGTSTPAPPAPKKKPKPQKDNAACKGPVATYSKGGSVTVVGFAGGNAGVTGNLSIPLHLDWSNPLRGVQLSFTFQAAYIEGLGAFAGYGETNGIGVSSSHAEAGLSSSHYAYAEADFGAGEAVGGSIQGNRSGASGAISGKIGEGAGAFAGGGVGEAWTFAFKPFGC